jgi:hypothetical protein
MITRALGSATIRRIAQSMRLGVLTVCGITAAAQDGPKIDGQELTVTQARRAHHVQRIPASGTLGYGPPGVFPGFQGFGLGFHLGYGYGGNALGVGREGGFPFYGGPGYPHCEPRLRRCAGINPFPYYGGPGYPSAEHPNAFGTIGPLVTDQPVVTPVPEPGRPMGTADYGGFTGAFANPEALFAPFTSRAAAGASSVNNGPSYPARTPGASSISPVSPFRTPQ